MIPHKKYPPTYVLYYYNEENLPVLLVRNMGGIQIINKLT